MLILTRRIGESLIVGDNVTLAVLGIKGNQVRIGVEAPKDVSVHRKEIYMKIHAENTANNDEHAKKIDMSDIVETLTDIPAKFMKNEIKYKRPAEHQQENSAATKTTPVIIRRKRRLTISTQNNKDTDQGAIIETETLPQH